MMAVLDTNVLVSGISSRNGYSFEVLQCLSNKKFEIAISTPLIHEYREVLLKKNGLLFNYPIEVLESVIDDLCAIGRPQSIFYLWRPLLKDPCDEMVLELAVASGVEYIITFKTVDFREANKFGIKPIRPKEFITILKGAKTS